MAAPCAVVVEGRWARPRRRRRSSRVPDGRRPAPRAHLRHIYEADAPPCGTACPNPPAARSAEREEALIRSSLATLAEDVSVDGASAWAIDLVLTQVPIIRPAPAGHTCRAIRLVEGGRVPRLMAQPAAIPKIGSSGPMGPDEQQLHPPLSPRAAARPFTRRRRHVYAALLDLRSRHGEHVVAPRDQTHGGDGGGSTGGRHGHGAPTERRCGQVGGGVADHHRPQEYRDALSGDLV